MDISKIKESQDRIKAAKKVLRPPKKAVKATKTPLAPDKLMLLFTVVNRAKAEYYLDFLQSFGINMQIDSNARGTAAHSFGLLGLEQEKSVIMSIVTRENSKLALAALEEKFAAIRGGKGLAFTVPMTSTIGVAVYKFLCNID